MLKELHSWCRNLSDWLEDQFRWLEHLCRWILVFAALAGVAFWGLTLCTSSSSKVLADGNKAVQPLSNSTVSASDPLIPDVTVATSTIAKDVKAPPSTLITANHVEPAGNTQHLENASWTQDVPTPVPPKPLASGGSARAPPLLPTPHLPEGVTNLASPGSALDEHETDMAKAKYVSDKISACENEMLDASKELFEKLATMTAATLSAEYATVAAMRRLIAADKKLAELVIDTFPKYRSAAKALKQIIQKAPEIFRRGELSFREYAATSKYAAISNDYLLMAEMWHKQALRYAEKCKVLDPELTDIENAMDYLKETVVFLDRLDQHLAAYPEISVSSVREEYLGKLRAYVRGFEDLRRAIKEFGKKVGEDTSTTAIGSKARAIITTESTRSLSTHLSPLYLSVKDRQP